MKSGRTLRIALAQSLCVLLSTIACPPIQADATSALYEQRQLYIKAAAQLKDGQLSAYRKTRKKIEGYVLSPYLTFKDMVRRTSSLTAKQVTEFRAAHADWPMSDRLYNRWLNSLGRRGRWREFLAHYEPGTSTIRRCLHARALLATGERATSFELAGPLWAVKKSQPDECNALFEAWIAAGRLTQEIAWTRLVRVIDANERELARYLQRFFNDTSGPAYKTWSNRYYQVHVKPTTITEHRTFRSDTSLSRQVIGHGLRRLARRDPPAAAKAWAKYQRSHAFSGEDARTISDYVNIELAKTNEFPAKIPAQVSAELALAMAEAAVENANWAEYRRWYAQLPDTELNEPRWRYWLGRADPSVADAVFPEVAQHRSYYGFLAADRAGLAPRMNDQPSRNDIHLSNALAGRLAVRRALELMSVGDELNARREWAAMLSNLTAEEKTQAAHLARSIGWSYQSILAANSAKRLNDLSLRFPIDHLPIYQLTSHQTNVPTDFLLAITRQESAFWVRARSSASARGLMQLMHATAKHVARRIGDKQPSTTDLYEPSTNIRLGAHYLANLLGRYGGRRPLAAAAYNAGEHRVDRWIKDKAGMPMDVWIETIPFKETRNYVQGVLAFHQVYAYRLDGRYPVLTDIEQTLP